MNKIILASASPRRRELLGKLDMEFEVIPSDAEEVVSETVPYKVVEELSKLKAEDVFEKQIACGFDDLLVIGSDTIVAYGSEILGKPKNPEHAFEMLKMLAGNTHQVYTGVTLYRLAGGEKKIHTFHECTDVTFYSMTDEEIWGYVNTQEAPGKPECMDKAGAYGIQGKGALLVERISGDYNNVVGLPLARLNREIKAL